MNDKKNIDRLFQERFKDFESVPDDQVWNNINDALHQKKKRRVIPLWWKISGIAAGFILAFLAFTTLLTTFEYEPAVTISPTKLEKNTEKEITSPIKKETIVATEQIDSFTNEGGDEEQKRDDADNTKTNSKTNWNSNLQNKSVEINSVSNKSVEKKVRRNNAVTSNSKEIQKENLNEVLNESKTTSQESLFLNAAEQSTEKNKVTSAESNTKIGGIELSKADDSSITNKKINSSLMEQDSSALPLATIPNPLEEILKKKNEKKEEVFAFTKLNRWQVTTNVAPIYFNSASTGSPIESQFAENSKSYENNVSVGIGVQYALNKKLSIRTGVNKITLGYGTNDIMFFSALNAQVFGTLNSSNFMSNIEVISANNSIALRPFEDNLQNMERGVLNQRMGYYEVPLELSYAVVNKKFGVHVIGGLSTLFLNENAVSVQSATENMSLGKANNLNDVHFSSNIGLGFKYEFWKNFEAHFEPTLKYQFNTFSRDAGNFRPYFVGLYSGVSYRF
jgi:hypothetical protein